MTQRLSLCVALLSVLIPASIQAGDVEDPGRVVRDTVNDVLGILSDSGLNAEQKRAGIYTRVGERIDFEGMSRRVLAVNWKKASGEQRARFQELFRQILLDTYWVRIRNYRGERVEYITGTVEGDIFATIDTVIITDKVEIPITYRMERFGDRWLAYDFLIESLSLVTNFRIEYRNLIKLHGIDGLLEQMEQEVARINAG